MEILYSEVLERLAEYRIDKNMSKADMARALGVDRSLYSRIEKGTKSVTHDILLRMYDLGIDIDYLVTGIKSEKTKLDELMERCMPDRRSNFINIMVSYMNVMFINDHDRKLDCKRQKDIMQYHIDEMNGHCIETVWSCIRKLHGYTQVKIIELLGINEKTYRKMEQGKTMPTLEILTIVYNKFGYYPTLLVKLDPNYLLMINNVWKELPEDKRTELANVIAKTLKDINRIQM